MQSTNNLLARIVIAKVQDEQRLINIFRETPVIQNEPNWRCRTWVANALGRISNDGQAVGTAKLDWTVIENLAREFVAGKTASGRYKEDADMALPRPTWDMLEGREVVP